MDRKPAPFILGSREPLTAVAPCLHHLMLSLQLRHIPGSHKNSSLKESGGGLVSGLACSPALESAVAACILQAGRLSLDGGQAQLVDVW